MHNGKKNRDKNLERRILRHMFRSFLLWLLSKQELHGYELIRILQQDKGFPAVTASKVYPLLSELCENGLISQKTEMHGKRAKKIYKTTAKGREALVNCKKHVASSPLRKQFLQEMSS